MLSLEKTSGLPIKMRDDYLLVFEDGLPAVVPAVREFSAMKNYLKNPSSTYWRKDVYHMYRNLGKPEHADELEKMGIQYDITVMPPGKISDEFAKTIGHYHSVKPKTNVRYPEVYEVLYGKVIFVIQSASSDLERLEQTFAVKMERGEKVIIPPGFGHVLVNPTDDVIATANWQPSANESDYMPYEKHDGGAYYVVESRRLGAEGNSRIEPEFAPNLSYKKLPELVQVRPRELPQYDLRMALPMYFTVVKNPESMDLLINPEKYLDELTPEKVFKT